MKLLRNAATMIVLTDGEERLSFPVGSLRMGRRPG